MERAELAKTIRVLRSGAESDFVEPETGWAESACVRGAICAVPRDAAREASDEKIRMQPGIALEGISR